ncbi:MAG: tRNA (adenosine(37)-N6)-threonylcarbamoyltransferase complex dimerization subunit type 1 TsaB [Candidatus Omnitrophota bacterium]|jgi:tRNA threonylcarbamoyladenosine biosynthesis protein TsaB
MKILGIDTTSKFLCIGVYNDGMVCEYRLEVERRLSGLLALTIKRVVNAIGWRMKDIDYLACGLGPGSFTGMRVGIAAIKGLALSLNKPVIGIPTLDILAANAPAEAKYIAPIIDAKRGLIYCAIYSNSAGKLKRITPYMLLTIDELLKKITARKGVVCLGDAIGMYKDKILTKMDIGMLLEKDHWYPSGHNIIKAAVQIIKKGRSGRGFKVKPVYIYPKECQIRKR